MKSTWKAAVAALFLIGSIALAQDAPAQPAASSASDKTASDKSCIRAADDGRGFHQPGRTRVCHRPRGCAPHSGVERSRSHRYFAGASRWQNLSSLAQRCAGCRPDAEQLADSVTEKLKKVHRRSARYRGGDCDQQQADLSGRRGVASGAMPMLPNMTVLQALSSAGLNQFAKTKGIYVLRTENGKQQKLPVNYRKLVKGEQIEQNYLLQPGDTIVVP